MFVEIGIRPIVFGYIKSVPANETHLVEIFVARELGLTDDVQILIENDDGEFTGFRLVHPILTKPKLARMLDEAVIDIPASS